MVKRKLGSVKETIFRITLIISVLGYIIIPFVHNHINENIAKAIWYPSNLFILGVIFSNFNIEVSKDNPMINAISNVGVFIALPVLPSIFVFNYYDIDRIWMWTIFAYAFVLIPCSFLYLLSFELKLEEHTQKEKEEMSRNIIKYIILYWLVDLLYMAIFNSWSILIFIFGILLLILIAFNLADAFLNGFKNLRFFMAVELILGMSFSGYLIYNSQRKNTRYCINNICSIAWRRFHFAWRCMDNKKS